MFQIGDLVKPKDLENSYYEFANGFMELGVVEDLDGDEMLVQVLRHSVDQTTGNEFYEGTIEWVAQEDFEFAELKTVQDSTISSVPSVETVPGVQAIKKPTGFALAVAIGLL